MQKSNFLIVIIILILIFNACSGNGLAREQIKNENNMLKDPLYLEAYKLYYENKYNQAYHLISDYVFNKKGSSLIIHSLFVKTARKANKTSELLKKYQKISEQKYYLFVQGVLQIIEERRKEECIRLFNEILYFFPENPVVQMYLGYLYILNNRPYLAEEILTKSTDNLSNFPFNYYFLALANYFADNRDLAIQNVNKALNTFPPFMSVEIETVEKFKKKLQET